MRLRSNKRLLRFLLAMLTILVFSAIVSWYFPWWSIAVISFGAAALFRLRPGAAFLAGASAVFLFWFLWGFVVSSANNHILLPKLASLFHLPAGWAYLLVSSLLGALVAGIAASAGALIRNVQQ